MNKTKSITTRTSVELVAALGLPESEAADIELRSQLNEKIIRAVEELGWSHAEVAKAAGASRSRVTAILNRNTHQVSTDLMLRILGALGYRARLTIYRVKSAA